MIKNFEPFYYKKAEEKEGWEKGYQSQVTQFVFKNYKTGDSLLEIGCGTGKASEFLPKDLKYVGIDISSFAINEAKLRYGNEKNREFVCSEETEKIKFDDKSFDFVMAIFVLEHIKKPKQMLNEMVRVLKRGGHLILMAPNLEMPFSSPNAIRHKNIFYKFGLSLLRIKDYFMRLIGIYRFRTLKENFSQALNKYEKLDDDLIYIASSFEVINFLKKCHKFQPVFIHKFHPVENFKDKIKKIMTFFPGMEYYGDILFIIMQK